MNELKCKCCRRLAEV